MLWRLNKWLECSTHLHVHHPGCLALGPDLSAAPGLTIWEIIEKTVCSFPLTGMELFPHGNTVLMKLMLFRERIFGIAGDDNHRYLS